MADQIETKIEIQGGDECVAAIEAIQPVARALPPSWLEWLVNLAISRVRIRINGGRWQQLEGKWEAQNGH